MMMMMMMMMILVILPSFLLLTLQVRSSLRSIFLAAKSLCMNLFLDKCSIPEAISRANLTKSLCKGSCSRGSGLRK